MAAIPYTATTTTTADTAGRGVRPAALLLLAGCAAWMVAGAPPALEDVYNADSDRESYLAIAEHAGLYRWTNVLMVVGTFLAVAGFRALQGWLRSDRDRRLARLAVTAAGVAAAAWVVEVAIRVTATVSKARDVAAGTADPSSFPGGSEPVFLVALVGAAAAIATLAWLAARGGLVWTPIAVLVTLACLLSVAVAVPITAFVFGVLPLAIGLLVRSRRSAAGGAATLTR
ncbi:MAG: hypothetical protein ACRD0G_08875 [Acidimicrobiales bacterium]